MYLRNKLFAHADFSAKPNTDPVAVDAFTVRYEVTLSDPLDERLDVAGLLQLARDVLAQIDRQRAIVIPLPEKIPSGSA